MRILISGVLACLGATLNAGSVAAQTNVAVKAPALAARLDHRELAADQQVTHALNRLTFGARPGDAQRVRATGLDNWIEQQLRPDRIDDSALHLFLSRYSILNRNQNDLLIQYAEAQRDRRMVRRAAGEAEAKPSRNDSMAMRQVGLARRAVVGQLQSARVARAA